MYHDLFRDARFWTFLWKVDEDLAKCARHQGCSCGGRLHCANYPRKPRGGENLPDSYQYRLSFCCDRDGCRKRTTPPSVRFLGRKVYLSVVVILVAAMRQGPSPRRVHELRQWLGVDRRTMDRWREFWQEHVPQTPFWKVNRGRFVRLAMADLPRALWEAFVHQPDCHEQWRQLLLFLAPITLPGALSSKGVS
jgi:hypothetical protein